jgi:hypothetical protein
MKERERRKDKIRKVISKIIGSFNTHKLLDNTEKIEIEVTEHNKAEIRIPIHIGDSLLWEEVLYNGKS